MPRLRQDIRRRARLVVWLAVFGVLACSADSPTLPPDLQALKAQAEHGDARAQTMLGDRYAYGQGVPQNDHEAAAWYRKAAEQGNAPAQFALGTLYDQGRGIPQDYKEAAAWYRKAAERGNVDAQLNLGFLYDQGHGVPQDYKQAAAWYRKAADHGHAFAQTNLGILYDQGLGVPQNQEEAYFWLLLSASTDNHDAVALRDRIAGRLTPAQVAAVQQRVRAWKPTPARRATPP